MKYLLISIHDRAINAFMPLANVRAEGEALRVFSDLLNDPNSQHHKHPDDYDLYVIGTFDDQTGLLMNDDDNNIKPRKIADGKAIASLVQPGQE